MTATSLIRPGMLALLVGVVACAPAPAHAQSAPQVFVAAYGGVAAPRSDTFDTTKVITDPDGRAEYKATYGLGRAGTFDIGGGVVLAGRYTAGLSVSRYASSEKANASLSFTHPAFHPTISAALDTAPLERTESTTHVSLGYRIPVTPRLDLHVFGGPSRFSVKQEMVSDLTAGERFSPSTRTYSAYVSDYETSRSTGSGWGYHAGFDAGVRLTSHISVGGMLRYTAASVDLEEPVLTMLEEHRVNTTLKVGGLQALAGIRIGL